MANALSKRSRTMHKMSSSAAIRWDKRMTLVENYINRNGIHSSVGEWGNVEAIMLERGVEELEKEMEADGGVPTEAAIISRELSIIEAEECRYKDLEKILLRKGLDKFVDWAIETNVEDWQGFLARYNEENLFNPKELTWSQIAKEWLMEHLSEQPQKIAHIKTAAVAAGIIDRDNVGRDWSKMTVLASREGLSGGGQRGWWGSVAG